MELVSRTFGLRELCFVKKVLQNVANLAALRDQLLEQGRANQVLRIN
jgi:hypothetical protein